jgi:hypothetical protein
MTRGCPATSTLTPSGRQKIARVVRRSRPNDIGHPAANPFGTTIRVSYTGLIMVGLSSTNRTPPRRLVMHGSSADQYPRRYRTARRWHLKIGTGSDKPRIERRKKNLPATLIPAQWVLQCSAFQPKFTAYHRYPQSLMAAVASGFSPQSLA